MSEPDHNFVKLIKTIVSVFDFSGEWSRPYAENGYEVIQIDIKKGKDIRIINFTDLPDEIYGILLAPPCTDFSVSGAQYWKQKDQDGRTFESIALMDAGLRLVALKKPVFWVLENPVGRIKNFLGKPKMWFQPHQFAGWSDNPEKERYTKKTGLWGEFNTNLKIKNLEPIKVCKQGSWIQKLGGSSEKTKELRSMTPSGFAKAFFDANR